MSKHARAAKLIEHCTKRGYTPNQIATLLHKFDLLAPDPPQLFFEHGHDPSWEIPINDQDGGVATVRALGGDIFIKRRDQGLCTNLTEAKQLAAAILAAAQYQEKA